jgi:hypothetical protein
MMVRLLATWRPRAKKRGDSSPSFEKFIWSVTLRSDVSASAHGESSAFSSYPFDETRC